MRGWAVSGRPGSLDRLEWVQRAEPQPAPDEVVVHVLACGVCRTDLHLAEHDLPPHRPGTIPGHEIVGEVVARGESARRFQIGDRIGIAWLRRTCGSCPACRSGRENLCRSSQYTGWDADGGFAEFAAAPEAFAYPLPDELSDEQAAPLLCSGIIGFRALRRTGVASGDRLGIFGFGASAHLTAQIAVAEGAEVHVYTRGAAARELAMELGAASAQESVAETPALLDGAIIFAPAGELVPTALAAMADGGTLVIAGIHLSQIPPLDYDRHLFRERWLTSVTANTRADGEQLLRSAAEFQIRPTVTAYAFDATDRALDDLAGGRLTGAAVVTMPT
jgi:propanol-preferring alcohol dehydrogenase